MRKALFFTLFCCCGVSAAASVLPEDLKDFRVLIEKEISIGKSIQVAKSRLEGLGLTCTWIESVWTNNIDRVAYYFCQRQAGTTVHTRWRVSLLPEQDKVVAMRTLVTRVDP